MPTERCEEPVGSLPAALELRTTGISGSREEPAAYRRACIGLLILLTGITHPRVRFGTRVMLPRHGEIIDVDDLLAFGSKHANLERACHGLFRLRVPAVHRPNRSAA
jgi:hypothetical protein